MEWIALVLLVGVFGVVIYLMPTLKARITPPSPDESVKEAAYEVEKRAFEAESALRRAEIENEGLRSLIQRQMGDIQRMKDLLAEASELLERNPPNATESEPEGNRLTRLPVIEHPIDPNDGLIPTEFDADWEIPDVSA